MKRTLTKQPLAKISLIDEDHNFLFEADSFNMEARYPDEKLGFHHKCTPAYTKTCYQRILSLYKILCQRIK